MDLCLGFCVFMLACSLWPYLSKTAEERKEERAMKRAALRKGGGILWKVLRKKL